MSKYKHALKRQLKLLLITELLMMVFISFLCVLYNCFGLEFELIIYAKAIFMIFLSWCFSFVFALYDIYCFWKR